MNIHDHQSITIDFLQKKRKGTKFHRRKIHGPSTRRTGGHLLPEQQFG